MQTMNTCQENMEINSLRKFRKSLDLTLKDVEQATGIDFSLLARAERGEGGMSLKNWKLLTELYECTLDELTQGILF